MGLNDDDFVMVFSGRITREKGVTALIDALIRLPQYQNIKLLVIGSSFYGDSANEDNFIKSLKQKAAVIKERIIFTHPSLLPAFYGPLYPGIRAAKEAIEAGVRITGASALLVTDLPENAKIILQTPVEVKQDDTVDSLQRRIMEKGEWDVLIKAINLYCSGKLVLSGDRLLIEE